MNKACFLIVCCLCIKFTFAQTGRELIEVTDMLKIKSLSSLSISKDGNKAIFTVTSIEPEGNSKIDYTYTNQLWLIVTDGKSKPKQLTFKENSSQAAFSPDGKQIVFTRAVEGKPQLFLLALDGGEAVQLTKFKYGASNPQWSPDGKKILFASTIPFKDLLQDSLFNLEKKLPVWSFEKPGFAENENLKMNSSKPDPNGSISEIRAYLDNNERDKKAVVVNKLNFQSESGVTSDMSFNHFFITSPDPDSKPIAVTKGFYKFNYAEFTPDSKQLIIAGNIDSLQHPDRSLEGEIYLVNADGGGLKKLLGESKNNFSSPRISPSGKWLAFQYGPTTFVSVPTLAIVPINGSFSERKDIVYDRNKSNIEWTGDEKYLYFTSQSNGGQLLNCADIQTGKTESLTNNESGVLDFDLKNNKLVFVKTEPANPSELYLADALAKNPIRLSSFNTEWLSKKKLSLPEKKSFVNDKNQEIEYWIMKPANYETGKKYPLLLEIHGGPSAMWGPGEYTMWHEYQYFCSRGYGVVYCNPRGSGGYGIDFLRSNINDWGSGPTSDVLTALDKTVKSENWVDTSKLLITGGSYAGYLVSWIIAHDHRFKAACSQRGVYDLATFFGEGNAWRLVPNYFGGYPWEPNAKATLERESPINYVQNITTPYIIFHGENDRRTGVIQSEMLYRSLKVLNKPVEYVRHPNATHEITRSGDNRQRIDQMLRTYEFFERWIH